jgi:hypothetical protein
MSDMLNGAERNPTAANPDFKNISIIAVRHNHLLYNILKGTCIRPFFTQNLDNLLIDIRGHFFNVVCVLAPGLCITIPQIPIDLNI